MIPGPLISPGQLAVPRVNFASVLGLMPVTVHMGFSLPRSKSERRVTRFITPGKHEPGTVNYPWASVTLRPYDGLLSRGNFALGQLHCPGASSLSSDHHEII